MFQSLQRGSDANQLLTFGGALSLQLVLLLGFSGQHYPPMYGPSLHHQGAHAAVTPIYFQPDAPAAGTPQPEAVSPAVPEEAHKPAQPKELASNAEADGLDDDSSADVDGQGLAPFASWSLKANGSNMMMPYHQFKTALPVFTPDPPILHKKTPEVARGKDLVLEVIISDQGSIVQATVLKGIGNEVEMSIMKTLRDWIFVPAKVNGIAVASRRQLRFHFPS